MARVRGKTWDQLGTIASLVCAVHCLVMAVFMAFLPILGLQESHSHNVDFAFIGLAVLFGGLSIRSGWKVHQRWTPAIWFIGGLTLVCVAHFALHDLGAISYVVSVVGGLMMVWFHRLNLALRAKCSCASCQASRQR
ncbi:MAG: MerC domain-containing protein [Chthonomonas sp.]|nr:MerC domain-containing protein [Chthonomonas sp.]